MTLTALALSDLQIIAQQLLSFSGNTRVFLFNGEMGAGKTTLIKELCAALGVTDQATSPTFSIVNEYLAGGKKVYHFDFYRLKNQTEALDMGCEEYFYSGNYCFIEWPSQIPDLLPQHYINVNIKVLTGGGREISVEQV